MVSSEQILFHDPSMELIKDEIIKVEKTKRHTIILPYRRKRNPLPSTHVEEIPSPPTIVQELLSMDSSLSAVQEEEQIYQPPSNPTSPRLKQNVTSPQGSRSRAGSTKLAPVHTDKRRRSVSISTPEPVVVPPDPVRDDDEEEQVTAEQHWDVLRRRFGISLHRIHVIQSNW